MSCGIYKITNLINQKSYIGQSKNIEERWKNHKSDSKSPEKSHYPLYRAFNKQGIENFKWEILEECPIEKLDEKEIYQIALYNTYEKGYNQTAGGRGTNNAVVKLTLEEVNHIYDLLLNYPEISQNEIAIVQNVGIDTISEINQGKTRINPNLHYPLRSNRYKENYCIDCHKPIYRGSTRCVECFNKAQRTVERPSREELKKLIRSTPFVQIGSQYGVSDKAIGKWCKKYNLPSTKKEIKQQTDEEWEKI